MDLSNDQEDVYGRMVAWFEKPSGLLTVGGYAGTGKSTLLGKLIREERGQMRIACIAYTGKASNILRQKLGDVCDVGGSSGSSGSSSSGSSSSGGSGVDVLTIHRLAYRPFENEDGDVRFTRRDKTSQIYDRFIIDEASMVSDAVLEDISRFGVPILAIGDHGQLPPVNGSGTLMADPHLRLEKIHRQAESSPIIRVAHAIRANNKLPSVLPEGVLFFDREPRFKKHLRETFAASSAEGGNLLDTVILTYSNRTRRAYNDFVRRLRWGDEVSAVGPLVGDVVICLRNNHVDGIFNGMRGVIESVAQSSDAYYRMSVRFPDDGFVWSGLALAKQFSRERSYSNMNELRESHGHLSPNPFEKWSKFNDVPCAFFDYGYAMTVHKSQGSQFRSVHLIMELNPNGSDPEMQTLWQRWAYTGVTRAAENLTIVDA